MLFSFVDKANYRINIKGDMYLVTLQLQTLYMLYIIIRLSDYSIYLL